MCWPSPLSAAGLDEIISGACGRARLGRLTCRQLRHTCFTRLREPGMGLEAIQAQAGLAGEYRRAVEAIEAQAMPGRA
jgi:integrase/recombinase XerD